MAQQDMTFDDGICEVVEKKEELLRRYKREKHMLQDILNSIPDMLSVHDGAHMLFSNWKMARGELNGGVASAPCGAGRDSRTRLCEECYLNDGRECFSCHIQEVLATSETASMEMYDPAARIFHSVSYLPVFDSVGKVHMVLELVRDTTESRNMERALRVAKDAAEAADKAKSDFLALMSHEIRTPMNGVLGMLDLALATDLLPEQREYLEAARNSAESLLALINDILDFSKIEAGMVELDKRPFHLRKRLSSLNTMFAPRAEEKNIRLTVDAESGVPDLIVGDPTRVRQIIVNLLGNALKFTAMGEVSLHVQAVEENKDSVVLEFAVRDTGVGIKEEQIKNIFNRFVQVDPSLARRHQGTGLGLAICKQLARLMGGDLRVTSVYGVGSTFVFRCRFGKGCPPALSDARSPHSPVMPGPSFFGKNLLVVEDHPVNLLFIQKVLEKAGFHVSCVRDGAEVLPALEREAFDLILMDIAMPLMDGMEASALVRKSRGLKTPHTVPIIAMTAHALKGQKERFLASGFDGYIGKPIDSEHLLHMVCEYLQKGGAHGSATNSK